MVKEIPLTKGYVALVDDEDYDYLMQWEWMAARGKNGIIYARRSRNISDGRKPEDKRSYIHMHHVVMGERAGFIVDHINHNGLNNQKQNLRWVTYSQNAMNRRSHRGSSSRYKGVSYNKDRSKWVANICINGKNKHLGGYEDEVDAAMAYDAVARELFGEFAYLNFPDQEAA